jgi:hypothetical protein
LEIVETTSPQSGEFALPLSSAPGRSSDVPSQTDHLPDIPRSLLDELLLSAKAESSGLTLDEFSAVLYSVGTKFNYGHTDLIKSGLFVLSFSTPTPVYNS